jgi:hypothetical protein
MIPSKRLGVITLANRTGVGLSNSVDRATDIALGLEPSTTTAPAPMTLSANEMHAYTGTYSQGPRTIAVLVRDGKLLLKQGNLETPLTMFGDDELRAEGGRYVFVRNASGSIEYLHSGSRSWRKVK